MSDIRRNTMAAPQDRRLYAGADLPELLQLTEEQIDWLVSTRQLQPLKICGESRYDCHSCRN
jgi:hypothetical protein